MVSHEEEREHAELEAEDFARQLAEIELEIRRGAYRIEKAASVADALSELSDLATKAATQDPKLTPLKSEIQDIRKESPNANVLIYSEYTDSQEPIAKYLTYLRGTFEERILLRLIAKYERQRELLTFVPNTLGITSPTDASAARLLKCFMDEDTKLFKQEETLFRFEAPEESDPSDPATNDLLEEIDRSLRAFQKASRTNAWLGVQSLNAEKRLLDEAEAAEKCGENESVDLAAFVLDVIKLDGGSRLGEYVGTKGGDMAARLGVDKEKLEYICRCLLDQMRVRGCLDREMLRYHPAHPSCLFGCP